MPVATELECAYRAGGWRVVWRLLIDHYARQNSKLKTLALIRLGRKADAIAELEKYERRRESAAMLELESPFYDPLRQELKNRIPA